MNLEKFVEQGQAAQAAVDEQIEHGRKAEKIIWELILSFPCLRHKFAAGPVLKKGQVFFEPDWFYKQIGVWSHGEQLCALFVLNVWNPGYAEEQRWRFDVFEFIGMADDGNKRALINWLQKPIWP